MTVGIVHPGEMGAAIGAELTARGHRVVWASEGRSPSTVTRARAAGLDDVEHLDAVARESDLVLSVCPPHAAADVAASLGSFTGIYVDANAIAPHETRRIERIVGDAGARYVDGGIVGPPPNVAPTRLYLSGTAAGSVTAHFDGTAVDARVLGEEIGLASAMKMCFAAWTKGTDALLLDICALARAEGVDEPLTREWERFGLAERSLHSARSASGKGWRWVGEMEQIAATFAARDLPDGFHVAAAEVFRRISRDDTAEADEGTLARAPAELLNAGAT
jgi:3-hydroxyisobutyrate dehydrogenase-like beta-hydroxyacid dehydrogenase